MILGLEIMLSFVSNERKKMIYYEKMFKLTINSSFNNVFRNIIFPFYRFLLFF